MLIKNKINNFSSYCSPLIVIHVIILNIILIINIYILVHFILSINNHNNNVASG
jgi:hypothetical protein